MIEQKSESHIFTILAAGALATLAFDSYGQAISPLIGMSKLAPVPLATQTIQVLTGFRSPELGYLLHVITGLIFYPLGWYLIARPIQQKLMPALPWIVTALAYGVVLWVFALYIMAHLVAGNPPFLGFTGITWVALIGHVLFAVVAAWIMETREAVMVR
ncbi:hypothetical protein [Paracoccus saliphilus]|uniref:Uncharacterized protein n=1 Tax=Paracoccus saliphilus TaxID=405559 RepID=A0AA46A5D1_9RHOB|nr:hypothetical protein [Paracoccus saliphilus]WCR04323.1 hypothetical protein JHX88_06220 [Paracoccus saliphilus]SIS79589.1 hypothetical protein SAMN05421772_10542 [Paracoccus saliphilus]